MLSLHFYYPQSITGVGAGRLLCTCIHPHATKFLVLMVTSDCRHSSE